MSQINIAIIGGGIGGLTLAIALQRRGLPVTVYEAAPEIKPLGAGLALAANAINAFIKIGVGDSVLNAGKVLKLLRIKDERGNVLTETDSEKISARLGVINNFTIHRADLHDVLIRHLLPGSLQLNKRCVDWQRVDKRIVLKFADGSTISSDYVIAADGIHSAIRKKLLPAKHPRYAGYTCWRGIIDHIPAQADPDETSETWGIGSRFGIVPLKNDRLYWFACLNAKQNDPLMRSYGKEGLLRRFGHFHAPIRQILESTSEDRIIWNDIIDLRPLKKFAFDNILLLGDAAHATTPNMGQGACMAVEDASVLATSIDSSASIEHAFAEFETRRIRRTTAVVNKSWNIGRIAQLENRFLIALRNKAIKLTPPSVAENQIKSLITD